VLVEQVVADHQGGTTAALLVSRLRIEGRSHEVALARHVGCHLPDLATDGRTPVGLTGLVALGDRGDQLLEIECTAHAANGRHDDAALLDRDVDDVADVDVGVSEQLLAQAKTLTVAPLLDLSRRP
jgi:hypothetical protein